MNEKKVYFRYLKAKLLKWTCMVITVICLMVLLVLLIHVSQKGIKWLSLDFLTNFPSRFPERAGIKSAIYGSVWMLILTASMTIPLGVSAALYLEEYNPRSRLSKIIEILISNLAGAPSIIYGILGLVIFVRFFALDRSLIACSMTMSLLVLPIVIIASREAIRAVPESIRLAGYALGVSRWQVVRHHVLPNATPGIMTGVILAMSRAISETAPLIMIGALTYIAFVPEDIFDAFTVLPIQIYDWSSRPQASFQELAAAGILVLLVVLLLMNALAILIRIMAEKRRER